MSIYSEHFETVFSIKENIQALRNKVLELAIQGKLVERDKNDEPASELLKRVQAEKQQLIKEKKIKKEKAFPKIEEGEIPFEIPESWQWVRLGDIGDWGAGATPNRNEIQYWRNGTVPWLKTGELNNSYIGQVEEYITKEAVSKSSVRLNKPGDVLIAMYGATIGKLGILEIEATTNQACCACTPYEGVSNLFLFYYLMANKQKFIDIGEGGAQPNISRTKIVHFLIALPPLEEQKKIVKRIENLMSKMDNLESSLERKERLELALPKAVVSAISNCQNEEELKVQLGLVIEHFAEVFKTPESLLELRNVILQLAIQGKLVPQNPVDEPASELLKHIQAEKTLLIKEKKIKKEKDLPEIEDDEIPFEIPTSWEWGRLGSVIELISGRDLGPNEYNDKEDGLPYYTGASNFQKGKLIENRWTKLPKVISLEGDLLITVKGTIGDMAFQKVDEAHIARQIMSLRNTYSINMRYLFHFMESYVHQLKAEARSMIPGISRDNLLLAVIPVPPVTEQHRIVDKIELLFAVIDKMEKEMQRKQRIVKAMATI